MVRPAEEYLERSALTQLQWDRLRRLLAEILPANPFYARKFAQAGVSPDAWTAPDDFLRVPFTTKAELLAEQANHPPYGQGLTYPLSRYCRLHQTSGTHSRPLYWLDTPESWNWILGCWEKIFRIIGLRPDDRLFFPFSFGPFLGFWAAFDAAARHGYCCLPGGGISSVARLHFLLEHQVSVLFCTPTYALRLAEVARQEGLELAQTPVRLIVVAGEPGGSIPATRRQIETTWGARVFDHSGMTEIGSLGIECSENPTGLHLLETECWAEVIEPATGKPLPPGEMGEMVLTNLGRWGSPLLRYRTGDLVRIDPRPCPCGRSWVRLEGGILGRTDDMIYLRGNNLYPSALEAVIRRFEDVAEYRVEVDQKESLPVLRIAVEPLPSASANGLAERISRAIRDELLFRAEVTAVPAGSLPRFEMKARRIVSKGMGN
ncbi:MAG TPA: AMP-binding protein [Gemmataceae bacterium]|nr:AMP-binding protein [Gemmataceae bacterium]